MLDIGKALKGAVQDLLDNAGILVGAAFTMTLVMGALFAAAIYGLFILAETDPGSALGVGSILVLLLGILGTFTFFQTGFIAICLKIQRKQRPRFSDLFTQGGRVMPAFIAMVSIGVMMGAGLVGCAMVPLVGELLGTVWGLLVTSTTCLTLYFIVDRRQPAFTAIASSFKATGGNAALLMILFLGTGFISSLISLLPLFGTLIAMCFHTLLISRLYFQLRPTAL